MHILVLPSWYKDPERPGSGIFFKQQALALAAVGHQVAVAYVESRSLRCFSLKKLGSNHFQFRQTQEEGVCEFCCRGWSFRPQTRLGAYIMVKLTLYLLKKYISKYGKPDIIHAHSSLWAGYIGKKINEKYGVKYVLTEHASDFISGDFPYWQRSYIHTAIENASLCFAVSSALADSMKKFCNGKNIQVLPNFVNTTLFRHVKNTNVQKKEFVFFSLGNLVRAKGFDILCRAFAEAFHQDKDVTLLIGGSGKLEKELKEIVDKLGMSEQVSFLGQIGPEQVANYMNYADAFVLASRVETFGIVFVEAMAAGKPVIATRCGGPENFVFHNCGYLIDTENIGQLKKALQDIRHNLSQFNSEEIQQYAYENFDSRLLALKLTNFYQNL